MGSGYDIRSGALRLAGEDKQIVVQSANRGWIPFGGNESDGVVLRRREIEDRDQKLVLFTGIKEARFRRPVVPGDTLVLEVTALRIGSRVQRMRGEAKVDGELAADAEIMSIVAPR